VAEAAAPRGPAASAGRPASGPVSATALDPAQAPEPSRRSSSSSSARLRAAAPRLGRPAPGRPRSLSSRARRGRSSIRGGVDTAGRPRIDSWARSVGRPTSRCGETGCAGHARSTHVEDEPLELTDAHMTTVLPTGFHARPVVTALRPPLGQIHGRRASRPARSSRAALGGRVGPDRGRRASLCRHCGSRSPMDALTDGVVCSR
jgi:hypothetical protein